MTMDISGGYNTSHPSQPSDPRPPAGGGGFRPPGPGAPRPRGPNALKPPGQARGAPDIASLPDDELMRFLDVREGKESDREVEELRKQVKELMEKNKALSKENEEQKGSMDSDASKQVSSELQSTLDALRRRVSCMHHKLETGGAPRGDRRTMRRASSGDSLFYAAGDLDGDDDEPAPGGKKKVMMDLTDMRTQEMRQEPDSYAGFGEDPPLGRNTAYSTGADTFIMDLTACRQTIKPEAD